MFKCLDRCRQEEIILLDCEDDQSRLPELRKAGRVGELLCPECKQPVLVKAGRNKAWHFAHKDLGSCPLAVETAAILQARRLLYRWLLEMHVKRNGLSPTEMANVTVEKRVLPRGDRPADCFVEFPDGHGFGYWILERGMRNRSELESSVKKGILHPVFLYSMLKPAESDATAFDLTPTERGLMVSTKYDPAYGSGEGSLHYLDCKSNMMTTLRTTVRWGQVSPFFISRLHSRSHHHPKRFQDCSRLSAAHQAINPFHPMSKNRHHIAKTNVGGQILPGHRPRACPGADHLHL